MKFLLPFLLSLGFLKVLWGQADFGQLREHMVHTQLKGRDIVDREVLRAMSEIPRHLFVPPAQRYFAYEDRPLPIGEGQTISQPYMVAFMTQALRLRPSDKVLEVGTGSGYQAAVLSRMADSVYTVEILENLGRRAADRLTSLGYDNVEVRIGDGYHGWPEQAPFDAIMVTAGAESVPNPLVEQLAPGGRMIIPVGPHRGVRELLLLTRRKDGTLRRKSLMAVRFVPFTRTRDSL